MGDNTRYGGSVPAAALFLLGAIALPAFATGLSIPAQSASGAAVAVAGTAAGIDDASTVFYNPAGMTRLASTEAVVALGISQPDLHLANTRGSDTLGAALQGTTDARNPINYIPSAYAVLVPSERLRFGMGISTPFGQSISYDKGWIGRYQVQDGQLQDLSFSAVAAYKLSEMFSVGGGLEYHRTDIKRLTAVDFGTACIGTLGLGACTFLGLLPQQADGKSRLAVSGHGIGYNLGMTADLRNGWRMGLTYRSSVKIKLGGDLSFDLPASAAVLNSTGAFDRTHASSTWTLPESLHWGLSWDIDERNRLLAGADWTRWNRMRAMTADFANPAQPSLNEPLHWRNAMRYSLGFKHALTQDFSLLAGLAYQQSPVNADYASPLFPMADASEIDVGFIWRLSSGSTLAFSYGYQHQDSKRYANSSANWGQMSGSFRQEFHAVGLQFGQKF